MDGSGIEKLIGTDEAPINADEQTRSGIFLVSGNHTNFFFDSRVEGFLFFVSADSGNNAIVQALITQNGLVTRHGSCEIISGDIYWSFGEWVDTGSELKLVEVDEW